MKSLVLFILGLVLDTFPKTWLLAWPSPVVQMGQNVSLWCRGPVDGVGLALYKKGEDKPVQFLDATSIDDNTSFFLNNVTYSDTGIYSCQYLLTWKTSIRMPSHNTVELMVVGKCKQLFLLSTRLFLSSLWCCKKELVALYPLRAMGKTHTNTHARTHAHGRWCRTFFQNFRDFVSQDCSSSSTSRYGTAPL